MKYSFLSVKFCIKFTLIGKIMFFCDERPDPTFDRFSILRFGGGGVEKALLGKFYGGQLLEEPALCTKRTRPPVLYLREHQTFLHPKIHNYSPCNVRLVVTGSTFESRVEYLLSSCPCFFVLYSSHICLIFVSYLSYIRLLVGNTFECRWNIYSRFASVVSPRGPTPPAVFDL